jgi:exosortase family protein XrtM
MFAGIYGLLEVLYFAVPDDFLRDVVYHRGIVAVSADIIQLATPHEPVVANANKLQSGTIALEIIRGCDGAGVGFLLISAIVTFPAPLSRKLAGGLAAIALAFVLNQARIVGLYYVIAYKKAWFVPIHVYFAPTLMIAVSCIFFAWWAASGQPDSRETA